MKETYIGAKGKTHGKIPTRYGKLGSYSGG